MVATRMPQGGARDGATAGSACASLGGMLGDAGRAVPAALAAVLQQLADVLAAMTDGQYVQKPVGVFTSSLGGHVRHCLDHCTALLAAVSTGMLDYDDRARGTAIETDRGVALAALHETQAQLAQLAAGALDQPLQLTALLTPAGPRLESASSLGRELVFVLSHTIHHGALIAAMCATLGISVPAGFGYAPATLAHLDATICAPSPSSH